MCESFFFINVRFTSAVIVLNVEIMIHWPQSFDFHCESHVNTFQMASSSANPIHTIVIYKLSNVIVDNSYLLNKNNCEKLCIRFSWPISHSQQMCRFKLNITQCAE